MRKLRKGTHVSDEQKRKVSKIVIQMDKEGNFIKEWSSILLAQKELKISHISACCKGKTKTSGGYIWKYKEE